MSKFQKKSPSLSQVRIIGGEYRRRLIKFVDADGLRPTPDRLRETLFNWLTHEIPNASVLDCCAGSGVLGFEALSRGAKSALFIEPNIAQYRQLIATATQLNIPADNVYIIHATAQTALATLPNLDIALAPFDIILLDPPYSLNLWETLLQLLYKHGCFHDNSLIYIEADRPLDSLIQQVHWLLPYKSSKVGSIYAGLFQIKIS